MTNRFSIARITRAGHVRFAQVKNGMDGHDHVVELRQNLVRKIERTIAQNVAFDPRKQAEAIELLVQLSNRRNLCAQLRLIDSVRLNRAPAVIGDAEILQAERLRGFRHFFERVVAVARDRVAVKRAPQIFLLDQFGERMLFGSLEFAGIFP